jgi:hypothetical protein
MTYEFYAGATVHAREILPPSQPLSLLIEVEQRAKPEPCGHASIRFMSSLGRPVATAQYASFYAGYVARVPGDDPLAVLEAQVAEIERLPAAVAEERELYRYAPGKWSPRQIVGHLADAERILVYRALAIARGEAAPLPGFDEEAYVENGGFDAIPFRELAEELLLVRRSSLRFFRHLPAEAWSRVGNANGHPVSVRALAFILAGHLRHHWAVLAERYGITI